MNISIKFKLIKLYYLMMHKNKILTVNSIGSPPLSGAVYFAQIIFKMQVDFKPQCTEPTQTVIQESKQGNT
jgi:hypothetical protein